MRFWFSIRKVDDIGERVKKTKSMSYKRQIKKYIIFNEKVLILVTALQQTLGQPTIHAKTKHQHSLHYTWNPNKLPFTNTLKEAYQDYRWTNHSIRLVGKMKK